MVTFWFSLPSFLPLPSLLSFSRVLSLQGNQLSDLGPDVLFNLPLQHCDLSGNSINGPIPAQFGDMTTLVSLNLSGNFFHGRPPVSLSNPLSAVQSIVGNQRLPEV